MLHCSLQSFAVPAHADIVKSMSYIRPLDKGRTSRPLLAFLLRPAPRSNNAKGFIRVQGGEFLLQDSIYVPKRDFWRASAAFPELHPGAMLLARLDSLGCILRDSRRIPPEVGPYASAVLWRSFSGCVSPCWSATIALRRLQLSPASIFFHCNTWWMPR